MIPQRIQFHIARLFCPFLIQEMKEAEKLLDNAKTALEDMSSVIELYSDRINELGGDIRRKEGSIQDLLKICKAQQRLIDELRKEGKDGLAV